MVDPIPCHPLEVTYVRRARAVPPNGRVPKDVSVVDTLAVLLREFSADDAPVSFRFGAAPATVFGRVGDGWFASYVAVARGGDSGPHDVDWPRRTCSRTDAGHPFDGTSRTWGVTSRVDHAVGDLRVAQADVCVAAAGPWPCPVVQASNVCQVDDGGRGLGQGRDRPMVDG